jgi:hypothetical protein
VSCSEKGPPQNTRISQREGTGSVLFTAVCLVPQQAVSKWDEEVPSGLARGQEGQVHEGG